MATKKSIWILFGILVISTCIKVQPSFADDSAKFVGTWRIVSYELETQATGEREATMGKNPAGYFIFTPEGRVMLIITGEGRKAPDSDPDRARLFRSMVAYTGMYRVEGDKWITKVDVAWAPERVGTEDVHFFRIDGDRLQGMSAWIKSATRPERGMIRVSFTLERVK